MQVLWHRGLSSVREVQTELKPKSSLAYTSVQTILNILERKKHVARMLRGRAYYYEARLSYCEALDVAVYDIVERICEGSYEDILESVDRIQKNHRSSTRS